MPVTPDKPGPYTSPQTVVDLLDRHRSRGLPSPVTPEVLARAGVSESLIPRTLQSLHALDLIDDQGGITPTFEALRLAPQDQYQQRLREWINEAYADVLTYVDPESDDDTKVRDAFRSYKPVGQQDRMVTLFLRLCSAAGMVTPKKAPSTTPKPKPAPKPTSPSKSTSGAAAHAPQKHFATGGVPPALAGLLASLPAEGEGWTKDRRDKFVNTFGAVIDFCYPIITANHGTDGNGD